MVFFVFVIDIFIYKESNHWRRKKHSNSIEQKLRLVLSVSGNSTKGRKQIQGNHPKPTEDLSVIKSQSGYFNIESRLIKFISKIITFCFT